ALDQPRQPARERPGLARPRARDHEERAALVLHDRSLGVVQAAAGGGLEHAFEEYRPSGGHSRGGSGTQRCGIVLAMTGITDWILGLHGWVALAIVFLLPALEASAFLGFLFPGEIAVIIGGVLAFEGRIPLGA